MFKKLRPFLCWGPVAQQKAIDKENEANQELEVNNDKEFECLNSDEQYTPNTKVFFEYKYICVLNHNIFVYLGIQANVSVIFTATR